MRSQFIRVEPYSAKKVVAVVAEANRDAAFCKHVDKPQLPKWWIGSGEIVVDQVNAYMKASRATFKRPDGVMSDRKQRSDHRCMVAGVISWPDSLEWFSTHRDRDRAEQLRLWLLASIDWVRNKFGDALVGVVSHRDEAYPHLHFFCVGDANALHPGLRAEIVDGRRLKERKAKQARYKAAMREFLDDYYVDVGTKFGLERRTGRPAVPRIKSRGVALRLLKLEQRMRLLEDKEGLLELANIRGTLPRSGHSLRL